MIPVQHQVPSGTVPGTWHACTRGTTVLYRVLRPVPTNSSSSSTAVICCGANKQVRRTNQHVTEKNTRYHCCQVPEVSWGIVSCTYDSYEHRRYQDWKKDGEAGRCEKILRGMKDTSTEIRRNTQCSQLPSRTLREGSGTPKFILVCLHSRAILVEDKGRRLQSKMADSCPL